MEPFFIRCYLFSFVSAKSGGRCQGACFLFSAFYILGRFVIFSAKNKCKLNGLNGTFS